jgi:hypothetical protein
MNKSELMKIVHAKVLKKFLLRPQPLARFSDPYPPEIKGIRNTSESFGTGALSKSDLEISLSLIRTTA